MKITNLARIFAGKKWVFYVSGVVVLGVVATSIWYCKFYIPQREFNKSLKPLLQRYSLIVEDINGVYTDESISIENFGKKSEEISKDLSDLKKTVITVDTPNDDAKEKINTFIDVLRLGIDAIDKGCESNDAHLQWLVSKSSWEWTANWYWSSKSDILKAEGEAKEWLDRWVTVEEAWSKKLKEYRELHNGLLENVKQMEVSIPELQFERMLGE
jgi:hypothetical protein